LKQRSPKKLKTSLSRFLDSFRLITLAENPLMNE